MAPEGTPSRMRQEALQAPQAVARLLASDADRWEALGARLREAPQPRLLTLARGSSDHAAQYMAYLAMARLGQLVTSLPMSVLTLYGAPVAGHGLCSLAFSQSGQSPDLVETSRTLRGAGALTVALVNETRSPLAQACEWVLPLHAGPETSVAATKSHLVQLAAGARLVAHWQQVGVLPDGLQRLPDDLMQACSQDWSPAVEALREADRLFVISRGPGLAIAQETALKCKEVCGLHAEAFSSAEVQHGPMALVEPGFPVLVLAPRGPAQAGLLATAAQLRSRGARVLLAAPPGTPDAPLPLHPAAMEDLDAISAIQTVHLMVEALAHARGRDPDRPPHLAKVTRTQ